MTRNEIERAAALFEVQDAMEESAGHIDIVLDAIHEALLDLGWTEVKPEPMNHNTVMECATASDPDNFMPLPNRGSFYATLAQAPDDATVRVRHNTPTDQDNFVPPAPTASERHFCPSRKAIVVHSMWQGDPAFKAMMPGWVLLSPQGAVPSIKLDLILCPALALRDSAVRQWFNESVRPRLAVGGRVALI